VPAGAGAFHFRAGRKWGGRVPVYFGRILGANLLDVGADEAVHSLIDAVVAKTPIG
jgi:hypothetical protein